MPIYEYQCTACGALHEALQKASDELLKECPSCGESALRKKVSAAAFRLKGGGWYETDFKSGNKKNLAGDSSAGESKAGKGSDAGSSASDSTSSGKAAEKSDTAPGKAASASSAAGSTAKGSGGSSAD